MLSGTELKEITSVDKKNGYFVSLYLNVDPMFNKKGDYVVHLKNMLKNSVESMDKDVYKKVKDDLDRIDKFVLTNKRMFKKGLSIISSSANSFWKEYHLGIPVKNDLIVDKTPYIKPLLDILRTIIRGMLFYSLVKNLHGFLLSIYAKLWSMARSTLLTSQGNTKRGDGSPFRKVIMKGILIIMLVCI